MAWYGHPASGARRWRCSPVASLAGELSARSAALVPRRSSVVCSWLVRRRRRALWAVVSVRRLLVCLTIDAAACRVRPRVDRARRQVPGDTQTMLTRARGTDSTTLLVTDQVEPSRSDGTLLMGADPHRRRKHASAMTDDGNTRHDRPHRWPGRQRHRRLLRRCLRRTPDQHVLSNNPCVARLGRTPPQGNALR